MGTRAKMSDKSHADLSRWAHCGSLLAHETSTEAYAALAEREARAILAETEPADGDASSSWLRKQVHTDCWVIRRNAEGIALAESLAAFIQS